MPRYLGRIRRSEQVLLQAPVSSLAHPSTGWGGGGGGGDGCDRQAALPSLAKRSTHQTGVTTMLGGHGDSVVAAADGADTSTPTPSGTRLVNVLIKMHTQLGSGMPEIGIVISPKKDHDGCGPARCRIKTVVQASPAAAAGNLRPGDVIRRVNMIDVSKREPEEIVSILRKAVIDCKWTYSPVRLQVAREKDADEKADAKPEAQVNLMDLMSMAIKKNTKMVSSKRPKPIRHTLLQRSFCDHLDRALLENGFYDVTYHL